MSTPRTRSTVKKEVVEKLSSAKRGKRVKKGGQETKKEVKDVKKEEEEDKKEIQQATKEEKLSDVSDTPGKSTRSQTKGQHRGMVPRNPDRDIVNNFY